MRMDQMDKFLEDRGFGVNRHYDHFQEMYIFEISRDGFSITSEFRYPKTSDGAARDRIQRIFLENMLDEFDILRTRCNAKSVAKDVHNPLSIEDVIFNPPATIVFWEDGTKTVVKDQGEECFDPEKGLAMAISKKALGNKGNYYNQFTKWVGKYADKVEPIYPDIPNAFLDMMDKKIAELKESLAGKLSNPYNFKTKMVYVNRKNAEKAIDSLLDVYKRYN